MGETQDPPHALSQPREKFWELDFIIIAFQISKLRLRKGQRFETLSSLTPELCSLPCPPYRVRLSALCQLDLTGVFHVKLICKLYEFVCSFCHLFFFFSPLEFLASQPGIKKTKGDLEHSSKEIGSIRTAP